jgi:hypothetical protein
MFANQMVFITVSELNEYLQNHDAHTLVNRAVFGGDLLEKVRANDNIFEITEPVDDGEWIEIDEMGYVITDFI